MLDLRKLLLIHVLPETVKLDDSPDEGARDFSMETAEAAPAELSRI